MDNEIKILVENCINKHGEYETRKKLEFLLHQDETDDTLTIVSNKGIHAIPNDLIRGELYYASEGSVDFSNVETLSVGIEQILGELVKKLQSKIWKEIYFIPFGHSAIVMQMKLLVYKITHIETKDWVYIGDGKYLPFQLNMRELILCYGE